MAVRPGSAPQGPLALPTRLLRRLIDRWRRSLQLRVVSTTVLLGLITVSVISVAMYRSIAEGLVSDRIATSQTVARQLTNDAQEALDQTDQTQTPAQLSQAVNDIVNSTLAPPADDRASAGGGDVTWWRWRSRPASRRCGTGDGTTARDPARPSARSVGSS